MLQYLLPASKVLTYTLNVQVFGFLCRGLPLRVPPKIPNKGRHIGLPLHFRKIERLEYILWSRILDMPYEIVCHYKAFTCIRN